MCVCRPVARLLLAAVLVLAATATFAGQPDSTIEPPSNRKDPALVATALWSNCLQAGRQAVLSPTKWTCTDVRNGTNELADLNVGQFDPEIACKETDLRRMPTGIIQALAEKVLNRKADEFTPAIRKNGIRLIGAAFCQDEVNLSDFEFGYPLVLDKAVFRFGFRARDMSIGGNLSFGGAYIYDNLEISDSKIGGTIFGNDAFIQQARILNSEVHEYLRFNRSILLGYFNLVRVKVGRGINVGDSRLSALIVRDAQVVERFNLNGSESTCKYSIEKSTLNEIRASNFGFGTTVVTEGGLTNARPDTTVRKWLQKPAHPEMLTVPAVSKLIDKSLTCSDESAAFEILDSSFRSLCIHDFHWTEPANGAPTKISIHGISVSSSMMLNLWPQNRPSPAVAAAGDKSAANRRILEIVGTNIGSLFFDFDDNAQNYVTSIDQVQINRVHEYRAGCSGSPNGAEWPLPDPGRLTEWLNRNKATSQQPFVAFIKAFENAGADTTDLKVAKAQFEFDQSLADRQASFALAWKEKSWLKFLREDFLHLFIDYPTFAARWILGQIVDFGYRPAQVVWTVLGIVIFSWLLFWFGLRVSAFAPEKKPGLRVVGLVFLFDRLLPLYRIRDEHYDIGAFYQRGSGTGSEKFLYFGRPVECVPAAPWRARCAQVYLDLLKACGIILAAFMVAAVNALIAR